tara:strand:+ start:38 stop:553 length:516 start_codon:yes stop_codon:yes gene_type:complete
MVIWIIGLSGAGKTTLAKQIVEKTRAHGKDIVLIDGDVIRDLFNNDLGYSLKDRFKNAERISMLCKFLDDQGIDVVCAILSLFPESRTWNREYIKNYYEVYIEAPMDQLVKRDYKGLYKKFEKGKLKNVAGMDIEFTPPENSDLLIKNNSSLSNLLKHSSFLSDLIRKENK